MSKLTIKGFTLIELMVVVAIISILAAVAYPAYTSSILKGRRAQARTALTELLQQQERYMTQRNCYLSFSNTNGVPTADAVAECGVTASTAVPFKTFSGDKDTNTAYFLSAGVCAPGSATPSIAECVRVIATPVKTDLEVGTLSITSTGVKACTGTASSSNFSLCWP